MCCVVLHSIALNLFLCICVCVCLSVCLSVRPSVCLSVCLANYLPIYLPMYSSIHPSIYPSVRPSIHPWSVDPLIYLSTHLPSSIYISTDLPIYLPMYLSTYPAIHPSSYPFIYLSVHISNISKNPHTVCIYIYISMLPSICLSVCLSVYLCIYTILYIYKMYSQNMVKTCTLNHKIAKRPCWSIPPNSSRSSLQRFWSKHHSMDPAIQSSPMDFSGRPNGDRKLLWHASMQRRKTLAKHLKIYKHMDHMAVLAVPKKMGYVPHIPMSCSMFHGQLGKKTSVWFWGDFPTMSAFFGTVIWKFGSAMKDTIWKCDCSG